MNIGSEAISECGIKKIAIISITDNGLRLAERLKGSLANSDSIKFAQGVVTDLWGKYDAFVFIMATGIVVRTIAGLMKDKKTDPAVVVLDEAGKFAISLVSGHLGGANELARELAALLGGEAVITTASDVNALPSIDLWAQENNLVIDNWELVPHVGVRLLNSGALRVYTDIEIAFPEEFLKVADPEYADMLITNKLIPSCRVGTIGSGKDYSICSVKGQLYVRPKNLVLGIGCNSGTSAEEIEDVAKQVLKDNNLSFMAVGLVSTIDIKGREPGLKAFTKKYDIALVTFTPDELNVVKGVQKSEAAFKATGAVAVAEPAALLAATTDRLLVPKQKKGNVTIAVAEKKEMRIADCGLRNEEEANRTKKGAIYIVGIGPGSAEHMTPAARDAIRKSDNIVGYGTYLDLIKDLLHDKEVVSTGMTQEVDRCRKAVDLAIDGKTVAVICGGDPGIYAMAGLVFEILKNADCGLRIAECGGEYQENPKSKTRNSKLPLVEVIPGISALNAGAARLGAPLMHDFACISLSDRLTPWPMIEKRLEAAAGADFVIVLYNPRSKGRAGHINKAREIISKYRLRQTPVGIVKGAMRDHETIIITNLVDMRESDIDMQTTVIIGNSKTFCWNNLMITPRGYQLQESKKVRG
jgi:cobalt-precorrin 5A hydrolase/precorrin-3B C17-methyltransferase